jgi:NADP-dependent 3-hydroxy acid dehydrogenase YdfG
MAYSSGKIAVITGAGSGIGRALVHQLNREGATVYASDINSENLDATLAQRPRQDVAAHGQVLDVADRAAVNAWAKDIGAACGHVDIVVNNAGVALIAPVAETAIEDFEWLMNINFWGVVYGTQAFLPLLQQATQGHLVNISSIFGIIGVPTQSSYNAAKFAVRGYTEALRQEVDPQQMHVCCVHPGGITTNIARDARTTDTSSTPEERGARLEEITITTPESAAAQIIDAIARRKKRLLIGRDAKAMSLIARLFPVNYPAVLAKLVPGLSNPDV